MIGASIVIECIRAIKKCLVNTLVIGASMVIECIRAIDSFLRGTPCNPPAENKAVINESK